MEILKKIDRYLSKKTKGKEGRKVRINGKLVYLEPGEEAELKKLSFNAMLGPILGKKKVKKGRLK